ncbi:C78 family peptidase [Aspergillus novofumigatus IBT 16806]|uniref:UFSP1/2/DUB catalytic domain-containing protein n=1 Tax=Aspergillus novofumigatus (strain IBT 16806) TaxID=1392255 RepID=A0A2I1CGL7_ASPN1|nr:uncharacterized protein P174DRAFT_438560 [Aspergillus novofumigatus IBT 16806]PKX96754.1 hypothetical protein P174DRAFT_438560 [Aspergillus novofumigatus IBT 16806]
MGQDDVHHPTCPFCPFSDPDDTFVAQHVEYCHPEGGGQTEPPSGENGDENRPTPRYQQPQMPDDENVYIKCPHGCGEILLSAEIPYHLDMHAAEEMAVDDAPSIYSKHPVTVSKVQNPVLPRSHNRTGDDEALEDPCNVSAGPGPSSTGNEVTSPLLANASLPGSVKRLGRAELGPYAHEKRMPAWLRRLLEQGAKKTQSNIIGPDGKLSKLETTDNEASNVISVLSKLCEQDKSVQRAFFCSPNVRQISKMPREGGFCGYRNIQMLISYIQESHISGHEHFTETLPTILQLQDMIESAWDMGFNSYIGTPEAQALFLSLGIDCEASSIGETREMRAHDALYAAVAAYFRCACSLDGDDKVFLTNLPPYICNTMVPCHSLTIVGFEIRGDGGANLLVFDPMFKIPLAVRRLSGPKTIASLDPTKVLKAYRRGTTYLQKYKVFELLKLRVSQPLPSI